MTAAEPGFACAGLEKIIRSFMAQGFELGEGVLRFMAATFGDPTPDTLQGLCGDDSSAERDSLLDLIFFPDPALQIAIEPVLMPQGLTRADVARVGEGLKAEPVTARLRIPGAQAPVAVTMPAFAVDALLTRLNLVWQPAAALAAAIARMDASPLSPGADNDDGQHRLRVRLRNAALGQTPVQVQFLVDFFERLPAGAGDFVDKLDFMLVFMKEHENAGNLYRALMARKKFLFRHLHKDRDAARFAARNNMETLVMTGVRRPYFDAAAAERTLVMIDDIAAAIFGRTEFLEGSPRRVDLGHQTVGPDPQELIRWLS